MATMLVGDPHEIPDFLDEQLVHCDNLMLSRNERCCIVLARNLKFYEFHRKQLVYSVDLAETCLAKVIEQLHNYKGSKGKWRANFPQFSHNLSNHLGLMETSMLAASQVDQRQCVDSSVRFGKYIYSCLGKKILFILILCWDKLVVLERIGDAKSKGDGYKLVAEYNDVKTFKIAHGKVKFQAALLIHFENGSFMSTDFQNDKHNESMANPTAAAESRGNIKQLLERARCAKAELQLHKATTQTEFDCARNLQTFGCDFVRSFKLEEKPMLARCGDVWLRFALNDTLVCGIPVVNNCSTESLTILKSLKPIFKINEESGKCLNYKYRMSQLRQSFESLESVETFFGAVDEDMAANAPLTVWTSKEQEELQLLPSCFAVMLITLKLSEIMALTECPLFIYFEVEKKIPQPNIIKKIKTRVFAQHLFIKNLNFIDILTLRERYAITFAESTLQQDFLTVTMTSEETKLRLQFVTSQDECKFQQLLVLKFKFHVINRQSLKGELEHGKAVAAEELNLPHTFTTHVCFNKDPTTLWYGSLAMRVPSSTEGYEQCEQENTTTWKFYIPNKEKTFLFLKLLLTELLLVKCNINNVELLGQVDTCAHKELLNLRKSIIKELELLNNSAQYNVTDRKELLIKLMKLQVNTDTLAM